MAQAAEKAERVLATRRLQPIGHLTLRSASVATYFLAPAFFFPAVFLAPFLAPPFLAGALLRAGLRAALAGAFAPPFLGKIGRAHV